MAEQHLLARSIDWIAGLVVSPRMQTALATAMPAPRAPRSDDFMGPLLMATGPQLDATYHGGAPATPAQPSTDRVPYDAGDRPGIWDFIWHPFDHARRKQEYDRTHTRAACNEAQYHGMHGRPCKYEGGSDTKCPSGTVSGWFWSYDVPGLGRVYYVDCCGGGTPSNRVWCNWTSENNWCMVWGNAANQSPPITKYFCTLAIREANMQTVDLGGGRYQVAGVDP
jgi:hypothetical protein